MPPGFPIQFNIPVIPAISTVVQFTHVEVSVGRRYHLFTPSKCLQLLPRDDPDKLAALRKELLLTPEALLDYKDATADLKGDAFFDNCGVAGTGQS
jgi:hypothetical protein